MATLIEIQQQRAILHAGATCTRPEGTDAEIWCWEGRKGPTALAYVGRAMKPSWCFSFRDAERREQHIAKFAEARREQLKAKQIYSDARKGFAHGLKPGHVLVSSWGYDQTNVHYYEVTEVHGRTVLLRELTCTRIGGDQSSDYVMPVAGQYAPHEEPLRKVPMPDGDGKPTIKISDYAIARPWSGEPQRQTAIGAGH